MKLNIDFSLSFLESEKELAPLYDLLTEKPEEWSLANYEEQCKFMFSRNVLFLRTYVGFIKQFAPFTQVEFAEMLSISIATLNKWENAQALPNRLSIKSVANFANNAFKPYPLLSEADIMCRFLVFHFSDNFQVNYKPVGKSAETDYISTDFILNALEHSTEGFIIVSKTGLVQFSNPVAKQLLGMRDDNHSTISFYNAPFKLVDADGSPLPAQRHPINRVFEESKVLEVTVGIHRNNGTFGWLTMNISPIQKKETGEYYAAVVNIRDMTNRKRIEEAMHSMQEELQLKVEERTLDFKHISKRLQEEYEAKEFLSAELQLEKKIIKHILQPIIIVDNKLNIINWSKGAEDVLGYNEENVIGELYSNLLFDHSYDKFNAEILNPLKEQGVIFANQKFQTKNGYDIEINCRFSIMRNISRTLYSIEIIQDDLQILSGQQKERSVVLDLLLRFTPVIYVTYSEKETILSSEGNGLQYLSLSGNSTMGKPFASVFELKNERKSILKKVLKGENVVFTETINDVSVEWHSFQATSNNYIAIGVIQLSTIDSKKSTTSEISLIPEMLFQTIKKNSEEHSETISRLERVEAVLQLLTNFSFIVDRYEKVIYSSSTKKEYEELLLSSELQFQKEWFKQFKTEIVQQLTTGIITALRGGESILELQSKGKSITCTCIPVKIDGLTDVVIIVFK